MRIVVLCMGLVALAGCGDIAFFKGRGMDARPAPADMARPKQRPGTAGQAPAANARTAEQFDTTSAQERQAASAAPPVQGEQRLGVTIASLGNPTDPGFWAETGLVQAVTMGRLEYPATGKSVAVELRPSGKEPGAGSQVSLPALRVLEAPLTSLPELVVFAGG